MSELDHTLAQIRELFSQLVSGPQAEIGHRGLALVARAEEILEDRRNDAIERRMRVG